MSNSSIAKSAIGVTFIMVIGYALSFAKEAVIANYFGISQDVDAYTIAIQIPVILFSFIAVAIQSVVVPLYSDILYKNNKKEANTFISKLMTIVLIFSLVFCVIGEIFAGVIVSLFAPGFSVDTNALSANLLRVTLPTVFFSLTSKIFTAVLNVQKRFVFPELSLIFLNIILICIIVFLHAKLGIFAACVGQVLGCFTQIVFLYIIIRKYFRYVVIFDFHDRNVVHAVKLSLPVFWSISVAELNAMINRMVASFLFVGSIASLSYSQKLNSIFITFFTSAIATIVYPMYAESAARDDKEQLNRRVNISISAYALILIPIMVFVIIYSTDVVRLAFARGAFDENAVGVTSTLLAIYAFGILFLALRGTITNVFYSLKDSRTPAVNASIGIVINMVLNLTLPFVTGINGIALASTISGVYISTMLLYLLVKKNIDIKLSFFYKNVVRILLSGIVSLMVAFVCKSMLVIDSTLLNLIVGFLIICISYLIVNYFVKTPMCLMIYQTIKDKYSK